MGVICRCRDDLRELLIPFVASRSSSSATEVADVYRRCFVGEISSADLSRELGVEGDPSALDVAHLLSHRLVDGVRGFLAQCAMRGLRVACISNDVSEWSRWFRQHFELEDLISPWVVSGDLVLASPSRPSTDDLSRSSARIRTACSSSTTASGTSIQPRGSAFKLRSSVPTSQSTQESRTTPNWPRFSSSSEETKKVPALRQRRVTSPSLSWISRVALEKLSV